MLSLNPERRCHVRRDHRSPPRGLASRCILDGTTHVVREHGDRSMFPGIHGEPGITK